MSPPRQGAVHKVRLLDSEWAWVNEEAERREVSAAEVVRVAVREMRRKEDAAAVTLRAGSFRAAAIARLSSEERQALANPSTSVRCGEATGDPAQWGPSLWPPLNFGAIKCANAGGCLHCGGRTHAPTPETCQTRSPTRTRCQEREGHGGNHIACSNPAKGQHETEIWGHFPIGPS